MNIQPNVLSVEDAPYDVILSAIYQKAFNSMNYTAEELYNAVAQIIDEEFTYQAIDDIIYLIPLYPGSGKVELCDRDSFSDLTLDDTIDIFIDSVDLSALPIYADYFWRPPVYVHRLSEDKKNIFFLTVSEIKDIFGSDSPNDILSARQLLMRFEEQYVPA